jgi:GntR family transcriptional regulator/MocR family aminotransferase
VLTCRRSASSFPGTEVRGIAADLHIIARLPERYGPEPVVLQRAAGRGIALRLLNDCGTTRPADRTVNLVLGHAHLAPPDIARGVRLPAQAQRDTRGRDIDGSRGPVFI